MNFLKNNLQLALLLSGSALAYSAAHTLEFNTDDVYTDINFGANNSGVFYLEAENNSDESYRVDIKIARPVGSTTETINYNGTVLNSQGENDKIEIFNSFGTTSLASIGVISFKEVNENEISGYIVIDSNPAQEFDAIID